MDKQQIAHELAMACVKHRIPDILTPDDSNCIDDCSSVAKEYTKYYQHIFDALSDKK